MWCNSKLWARSSAEWLRVIATICICLKNLGGDQFYRGCHMLGLIIVSTVKLKANAFPSSSSGLGLRGIFGAHFPQSTESKCHTFSGITENKDSLQRLLFPFGVKELEIFRSKFIWNVPIIWWKESLIQESPPAPSGGRAQCHVTSVLKWHTQVRLTSCYRPSRRPFFLSWSVYVFMFSERGRPLTPPPPHPRQWTNKGVLFSNCPRGSGAIYWSAVTQFLCDLCPA